MLEVRDVVVRFGGLTAVDGLAFPLHAGEVLGVIGPNGAGKTTMVDVITGVTRPRSGSVWLGGQDVTAWAPHRRAHAGLSRSFQTVGLAPGLSARENVLGTLEALERVRSPFPRRAAVRRRQAEVDRLLGAFGLEAAADLSVTDLPLGTVKRVELAKVFAGRPSVVLLDEPFAGLSRAEARDRAGLITRQAAEHGAAVLIVEHDVPLLMDTATTLLVLERGRRIALGPPQAVMADPVVRAAYLGDAA
ncbi:ABC transporter ATP-binding protein [Trujillonella humicola]|uniref:ABC transporter ATP-binding protein n=1 Tax=Trujillonella humicola TaxID=3383699 RepID=UPI0039064A5E